MRHRLHVAHRRARASYTRPEDDDTRRTLSGSANARKPVLLGLGPPFLLDGNQPHPHWPKPVSRSTAKGPVRQGGPPRTSFYLRKDARGLQRELHVNPGVTPTPHCTTWPTSATASLGQQRDTGTLSFTSHTRLEEPLATASLRLLFTSSQTFPPRGWSPHQMWGDVLVTRAQGRASFPAPVPANPSKQFHSLSRLPHPGGPKCLPGACTF